MIVHFLLLAGFILLIARAMPRIYIAGYGTAVLVAVVYGVINITLGTVLKVLSIPFIIVTLGIFLLLINTFLLWLTDELIEDFEIEDGATTFIAAVLITFADTTLTWIL
ncbi:MAG: phage holin family protein [Pseudomonadales bacterium]|nr:phage holin family protein [Pseudomonadales bacterium]